MMGADLYIESNYNALQARLQPQFEAAVRHRDAAKSTMGREEAQREVEQLFDEAHPPTAYFRDSYGISLLATLDLSWWRDLAPKLTEDDHLPLDGVRWLLGEVRRRRINPPSSLTYEQAVTAEIVERLGADAASQVAVRDNFTADDVEWLVSRKQALIVFLETCVELSEAPVCSL